MTDADRPPRPGRRRLRHRRRLLARRPPAVDHRRRGRPPAVRERERPRSGARRTARSTTTTRCATSCERRGHVLRSRCDTEVLPHLYEEHGPALAERLRGMFAVAVWDRDARRGVLVRDRLGIKPLYYAHVGDVVVFGSELKCVIASGLVSDELDHEAIAAYLTLGYVPEPADAAAGRPQARARASAWWSRTAACGVERWWSYPAPAGRTRSGAAPTSGPRACCDKLDESVRMRLMSDVPLGAMLSGGLDSSLIVALMARHMDQPVKTFAVGFAGADSELPRRPPRRRVHGAEHHELEVELATGAGRADRARLAPRRAARRPLLARLPRALRAGRPARHRGALGPGRRRAVRRLPQAPRRLAGRVLAAACPARCGSAAARGAQARPRAAPAALRDALEAPRPGRAPAGLERARAPGPARPALRGRAGRARRRRRARSCAATSPDAPGAAPLEAALYLDAQLGLVDDMLTYFDRASMARSLEVRVPFLDHELVELCATIPTAAKVHRLQGKHVLRRGGRGPGARLRARQAQARVLQRGGGDVAGRRRRRVDATLLLAPDPRLRARWSTRAVVRARRRASSAPGSAATRRSCCRSIMLELWLGEYLPRAFASAGEPARAAA